MKETIKEVILWLALPLLIIIAGVCMIFDIMLLDKEEKRRRQSLAYAMQEKEFYSTLNVKPSK